MPFLIETDAQVDHDGSLRLDLKKHLPLTKRLELEAEGDLREGEAEWALGLHYRFNWGLALAGRYGSKERFGLGVALRF